MKVDSHLSPQPLFNEADWILIFKLADRMRSMRTNGASKNRDWWSSVILSFLECLCYFGTYGMYTYGKYIYGMYTYGMYTYGM